MWQKLHRANRAVHKRPHQRTCSVCGRTNVVGPPFGTLSGLQMCSWFHKHYRHRKTQEAAWKGAPRGAGHWGSGGRMRECCLHRALAQRKNVSEESGSSDEPSCDFLTPRSDRVKRGWDRRKCKRQKEGGFARSESRRRGKLHGSWGKKRKFLSELWLKKKKLPFLGWGQGKGSLLKRLLVQRCVSFSLRRFS